MKSLSVLYLALASSLAAAQDQSIIDAYLSYIDAHSDDILSNTAFEAYISTAVITTPAALQSWASKFDTVSDDAGLSQADAEYPSTAGFELATQIYPTSIFPTLGAILNGEGDGSDEGVETGGANQNNTVTSTETGTSNRTTTATSTRSTTSKSNVTVTSGTSVGPTSVETSASAGGVAAMATAAPLVAIMGLSGLVAGVVLF